MVELCESHQLVSFVKPNPSESCSNVPRTARSFFTGGGGCVLAGWFIFGVCNVSKNLDFSCENRDEHGEEVEEEEFCLLPIGITF